MKYNKLGDSGLLVSELSFGSWITFNGSLDSVNQCHKLMKLAYDNGVNFFDNAEAYESGMAESLMGQAINRGIQNGDWEREDLVVSTKIFFGSVVLSRKSPDYKPARKLINKQGLSRKKIIEGTLASLKRMKLEYCDLIFCHRFDPITPVEEVVRAFNYLIDNGYCFYWGTSEWTATQVQQAFAVADRLGLQGPVMEQPEYNVFERQKVEADFLPLYPRLGLTTWSPLAGGILTGKYSKNIPQNTRYASMKPDELFQHRVNKTDKLLVIAEDLGCSLGQLALAWCISNPDCSTVITGATSEKQVLENIESLKVVPKLTAEVKAKIDEILETKPIRAVQSFRLRHISDKYDKSRL